MKAAILILIIFMAGCESTVETKTTKNIWGGSEIKIVIIEECEYLYVLNDTRSLTHKGNCNNPIHKFKTQP